MKFYVIPPIAYLDLMSMGDSIFVLAHLYRCSAEYRRFVKARKAGGWFVTLDNGAAEKALVTEDQLIEIVYDLMPDEVISPDVLYSAEHTLNNLDQFIIRMDEENLLNDVNVFAVPQGQKKDEWMYCYETMVNNAFVSTIGLSKIAVPYAFLGAKDDMGIAQARKQCIAELDDQGLLIKPIHCLGMGDPREFFAYQGMEMIRSTDSCYSVLAGYHLQSFQNSEFERIPTPEQYFNFHLNPVQLGYAESNILWMREQLHK